MTPRRAIHLFAIALLIAASSRRVRTDDPVSSNVRYTREIVRIFDRKCAACHGTDSLAMSLGSYRDVRDWGRAIREEIVEQRMPPWSAARGYAPIRNELALTAREAITILSWLDGGMPRGDDKDLPAAPTVVPDVQPDARLPLPMQRVPARDEHVIRRVAVATDFAAPRDVARVAFTPGRRGVLRGALIFVERADGSAQWIGAWLPWASGVAPPLSHAFRLPAGSRIAVELHYRGGDQDIDDTSTVDVYFTAPHAPQRVAPIDELLVSATAPVRLTAAATVWAVIPSADASTPSLELSVRRPNGSVDVLLWIPEFHREWPQTLVLQNPTTLPAGTIVRLAADPVASGAAVRLSLLAAKTASRATR